MLLRIPWADEMAVDLGTWQTQVCVRGHGVVVREPSLVAYTAGQRRPVAFGTEARKMLQRGVEGVTVVRPIRGGAVAEFETMVAMLRHFLQHAAGRRFVFSPDVLTSLPAAASAVQRRAAQDALHSAGCGATKMVEAPLAAALGAGLSLKGGPARLVVDIGAGVTNVGVFGEGIVSFSTSFAFGGENLDEAIVRAVKRDQGLAISRVVAEALKLQVGTLDANAVLLGTSNNGMISITDAASGLETVDTLPLPETMARALRPLVDELAWIMEGLPAHQRAELDDGGVMLCGGTALLGALGQFLASQLSMPVTTATDPMSCTALGLETILENVSSLSLGGRRFQPGVR
jgi:rod shape-determining protein MreB and related proteins